MGKTLNQIHVECHALRSIGNTPTIFEQKINKIIADVFADQCDECKQTSERLKYQPIVQEKKSFIGGLFK